MKSRRFFSQGRLFSLLVVGGALSAWALADGATFRAAEPAEVTHARSKPDYLKDVPLIPRRTIFGNPERAGAQISPDGKHLSYLAPVDGVLNVWVAPVDDITKAVPVTEEKDRPIGNYNWAYDNKHIL